MKFLAHVLLPITLLAPVARADTESLMAFFSFNSSVDGQRDFTPDVTRISGPVTLSLAGANVSPTRLAGNAFIDFEGTNWPAGSAVSYVAGPPFIGNEIFVDFLQNGFNQVRISYDYRSVVNAGATLGIRLQGSSAVFSQLVSADYIGDAQWHRLTHTFTTGGITPGTNAALEIGLGPNRTTEVRFDNLQLVGVPEPSAIVPFAMIAIIRLCRLRFVMI